MGGRLTQRTCREPRPTRCTTPRGRSHYGDAGGFWWPLVTPEAERVPTRFKVVNTGTACKNCWYLHNLQRVGNRGTIVQESLKIKRFLGHFEFTCVSRHIAEVTGSSPVAPTFALFGCVPAADRRGTPLGPRMAGVSSASPPLRQVSFTAQSRGYHTGRPDDGVVRSLPPERRLAMANIT